MFAQGGWCWLGLGQAPAPRAFLALAEQPLGLPGQKGFPAERCVLITACFHLNRMLGNSSIKWPTSGNTIGVHPKAESTAKKIPWQ